MTAATIRRDARKAIGILTAAYTHISDRPTRDAAGDVSAADIAAHREISRAMDRVSNAAAHAAHAAVARCHFGECGAARCTGCGVRVQP